ncbi:MAG: ABC transporter ATP-binding protein [Planctomycetaceae bacterium]|jgi:zinc transport system ATP-binding protein|nr:ABC transporter ATP-binding protein [Planctomycetaceae bacterium]
MNAVEFNSVTFSYQGPAVIEHASFSVQEGDFAAIVGPNGGGKTTLLKLMIGLLLPQTGSVRLFGKPPRSACFKVGYTPQFLTVDFSFPLSVQDVVLMGRMQKGKLWYSRNDKKTAHKALQTMQLEEYADVPFRTLSGGQRQRVLIARAVCGEPEILLLDEPTNNIDSRSEEILSDILTELNKRMTIAVVSHDVGFVDQSVSNVICVNRTVAVHSTADRNGQTIHDLYGQHDRKLILHET